MEQDSFAVEGCIYIPPGDYEKESHRLGSFRQFSANFRVTPALWAARGFYHTGRQWEELKCFSCGFCKGTWTCDDDPNGQEWHYGDCKIVSGTERRNIATPTLSAILHRFLRRDYEPAQHKSTADPLQLGEKSNDFANLYSGANEPEQGSMENTHEGLGQQTSSTAPVAQEEVESNSSRGAFVLGEVLSSDFKRCLKELDLKRELDRRTTFLHCPFDFLPSLAVDLAKDGFFYLGNLDRVQCAFCSGITRNWKEGDDVRATHKKHFPGCSITSSTSTNIRIPNEDRQPLEQEFDLVRSEQFRRNTEVENESSTVVALFPHRWSNSREQSTCDSAYPTDFDDDAICWYCEDGKTTWKLANRPWREPRFCCLGCQVRIRMKWVEYVRKIAALDIPHLCVNHLSYYDTFSMAVAPSIDVNDIAQTPAVSRSESENELEKFHRISPPRRNFDSGRKEYRNPLNSTLDTKSKKTIRSTSSSTKGLRLHRETGLPLLIPIDPQPVINYELGEFELSPDMMQEFRHNSSSDSSM